MITRFPYYAAPAFNELFVDDDTNTSIDVSEVGGLGRSVTLHHVMQNGVASFDLKNFVSKLFYNATALIPTQNNPGWAFLDYRLQTRYTVGDRNFMALNAVQDKGHSLDLLDEGDSGALTLRPIVKQRIEIPKYEGFPTGVSLMYKNMYGLDYSNATKATIEITRANTQIILPWYYDAGSTDPGGYISWGDGDLEEMTAAGTATADRMRHTYVTPGQYEIAWIPVSNVSQCVISPGITTALAPFGTAIRNYTQFSDQVRIFTAYNCTGLQRIDAVLPARVMNVSNAFRGCTNLTYINPAFFSNIRQTLSSLAYAFQDTINLKSIDPELISSLTNVTSLAYCFNNSGIENITPSMFALMSKVTDCSYAFAASKLRTVSNGMFSVMVRLANVTGMFMNAKELTSFGANVFNSSAATIPAVSICEGCTALTTIQSTSFKGLVNITTFSRAFYGDVALTALPSGVFTGMPKVTTFAYGCTNCTGLRSLPLNLFDSWTALNYDGMTCAFSDCINLNMSNGDIFKYNRTLITLTQTFRGCKATTALNVNFFRNMPQLTSANSTFSLCGLTTLPLGLFTNIATTLSLSGTFMGNPFGSNLPTSAGGLTLLSAKCTNISSCFASGTDLLGITSVPADIFDVYAGASNINMSEVFSGNKNLATVPGNLFAKARGAITNISRAFRGVGSENVPFTIPRGLLDPLVNVTSVSELFYQAYIIDIPSNLFSGMSQLVDVSGCFVSYPGEAIPVELFAINYNLENVTNCFAGSRNLTTIPAGLHANNAKLKYAGSYFRGSSYADDKLVSVPETLFDPCPLLIEVSGMFARRRNLANVGDIFKNNPLIANFNAVFSMYEGSSSPRGNLTGRSPRTPEGYRLWERAGKSGYPATVTGTECFYYNGVGFSDYNDIPLVWRQI